MTGNTATYAIPYPSSDDPIAQGAETIRQGMERVDGLIGGDGVEHYTNLGSAGADWGIAGLVQEGWREGPNVYIYIEIRRHGATIDAGTQGSVGDSAMLSVDYGRLRPPRPVPFTLIYKGGGSATFGGTGEMYRTGTIVLTSLTPNTQLIRLTEAGQVSVWGWLHFISP